MKERISSISRIALGVLFGSVIGIALDNMGLWISLGLTMGVALDYAKKKESSKKKGNKNEK